GGNISITDADSDNNAGIGVTAFATIDHQIEFNTQGNLTLQGEFVAGEIRGDAFGNITIGGLLQATNPANGGIRMFAVGTYASGCEYLSASDINIRGVLGVNIFDDSQTPVVLQLD